MESQYVGEHLPGNTIWRGRVVKYLDDSERAAHQLHFKNGKIYDANGNLFDTSAASTHFSGAGKAIYVMDADGNFFASPTQIPGKFHHSSLAAGQPVGAAGELRVQQGVLKEITDKSGHYLPSNDLMDQAVDVLASKGIDTARVIKTPWNFVP